MSQIAPPSEPQPLRRTLRTIVRLVITIGVFALAAVMMMSFGADQATRLHREKYLALLALLEKEVERRPLERDYVAPVSPQEVAELIEQAPAKPIENKGTFLEEHYVFERGVLGSLELIVFYKPTPDGPRLCSVASDPAARRLTQPLP
jgi:hypothetical protein